MAETGQSAVPYDKRVESDNLPSTGTVRKVSHMKHQGHRPVYLCTFQVCVNRKTVLEGAWGACPQDGTCLACSRQWVPPPAPQAHICSHTHTHYPEVVQAHALQGTHRLRIISI